jgi:hypothetical protein
MSEKISQVPEAVTLANTDLVPIAKDTGVGPTGYSSQHTTIETLGEFIGPTINLEDNDTFLSTTTINNLVEQISTTDIEEGDNLYFTEARTRTEVEEETDTTYLLTIEDGLAKWKSLNSSSDITVTIPPQTDVAWEVDTYIELHQAGEGTVTLAGGSGVELIYNENLTAVLNGLDAVAAIKRLAEDRWIAFGNLVPL